VKSYAEDVRDLLLEVLELPQKFGLLRTLGVERPLQLREVAAALQQRQISIHK
jgi:hypothetical protein